MPLVLLLLEFVSLVDLSVEVLLHLILEGSLGVLLGQVVLLVHLLIMLDQRPPLVFTLVLGHHLVRPARQIERLVGIRNQGRSPGVYGIVRVHGPIFTFFIKKFKFHSLGPRLL